jgi:hypothetical protein
MVEDERSLNRARLWERVFEAIRDGELGFGFSGEFEAGYGGRSPPPHYMSLIKERCVNALFAIENGEAIEPWRQLWVQRMLVSATAFDKTMFPADPKQRPGPKPVVDKVAAFIMIPGRSASRRHP